MTQLTLICNGCRVLVAVDWSRLLLIVECNGERWVRSPASGWSPLSNLKDERSNRADKI